MRHSHFKKPELRTLSGLSIHSLPATGEVKLELQMRGAPSIVLTFTADGADELAGGLRQAAEKVRPKGESQ